VILELIFSWSWLWTHFLWDGGNKSEGPPRLFLELYDSKGVRQGRFFRGLEVIDSKGVGQGRILGKFCNGVENKGLT
jgi:hypothetical protein